MAKKPLDPRQIAAEAAGKAARDIADEIAKKLNPKVKPKPAQPKAKPTPKPTPKTPATVKPSTVKPSTPKAPKQPKVVEPSRVQPKTVKPSKPVRSTVTQPKAKAAPKPKTVTSSTSPSRKPTATPAIRPQREVPGVTFENPNAPRPAGYSYFDEGVDANEFALARASQQADEAVAAATPPVGGADLPPVTPATTATGAAPSPRRPGRLGAVLPYGAAAAPAILEAEASEGVKESSWYTPLKIALNAGALLATPRLAKDALKLLKYKPGPTSRIPQALQPAAKNTSRILGLATGASTAAGGLNALTDTYKRLTGGIPAAAEDLGDVTEDTTQQLDPGLFLPGYAEEPGLEGESPSDIVDKIIDDALGRIDAGIGTEDDANTIAQGESAQLEDAVDAALKELEDAMGGPDAVEAGIAGGDPILMQQLAAIEADYQAGQAAINANYEAALSRVSGYQTQSNQLLTDAAAAMGANFEAAAGGLEGISPGTGMTADQAAAAGISDTALGGAGVTGAALARGLSGATQAEALADKFALGTAMSDQLASGALSQADLQAALAREAMGAKGEARTASAVRESEARKLKQQQDREDRIRIAELKLQRTMDKEAERTRKQERAEDQRNRKAELRMNAELDLAMKVAGMTPEERADYLGSKAGGAKITPPSWLGKRDTQAGDKLIDVKGAVGPVTVDDVNMAADLMDVQLKSASARNRETAQEHWTTFYETIKSENPNYIAIYRKLGRPTTAGAMVAQLFK